MTFAPKYRAGVTGLALVAAGLSLSGCLGGPTYGTDKTATEQLVEDLGSAVSLPAPKGRDIAYQPRPELVQPPKGEQLPVPQQSVASAGNPQWPESPEETRKRLLEEVDANSDNNQYSSPLSPRDNPAMSGGPSPAEQRLAYQRARALEKGSYDDKRRFLSDPPLTYRAPSDTAPVGDLGTPEKEKERERLAAAKKKGSGRSWWPF